MKGVTMKITLNNSEAIIKGSFGTISMSHLEFWDIINEGDKIDVKNQVLDYLDGCEDGCFKIPTIDIVEDNETIDAIVECLMEENKLVPSGDNIYDAIERCI
jgi:hypothetical protein